MNESTLAAGADISSGFFFEKKLDPTAAHFFQKNHAPLIYLTAFVLQIPYRKENDTCSIWFASSIDNCGYSAIYSDSWPQIWGVAHDLLHTTVNL